MVVEYVGDIPPMLHEFRATNGETAPWFDDLTKRTIPWFGTDDAGRYTSAVHTIMGAIVWYGVLAANPETGEPVMFDDRVNTSNHSWHFSLRPDRCLYTGPYALPIDTDKPGVLTIKTIVTALLQHHAAIAAQQESRHGRTD